MLRAMVVLFLFGTTCLAQSSSDGSFLVRHRSNAKYSLSPTQMREAEKLYRNTCAVVQRDFHSRAELHPKFTVIVGSEHNEVHGRTEIWLTKWNPVVFAQGVVVVAFDQILTSDAIQQLAKWAVQSSEATVDVADLK
jgi:hypothetical protein